MTSFNDDLRRALERLNKGTVGFTVGVNPRYEYAAIITQPLAALIEAAAEPYEYSINATTYDWCRICDGLVRTHDPDCALVGLIRAINGD